MDVLGQWWHGLWDWDGGGTSRGGTGRCCSSSSSSHRETLPPSHPRSPSTPRTTLKKLLLVVALTVLVLANPCGGQEAEDDEGDALNVPVTNPTTSAAPNDNQDNKKVELSKDDRYNQTCYNSSVYYRSSNDTSETLPNKTITVAFLTTRKGPRRERLGLKIPGAFVYSLENINNRSALPDGFSIMFEMWDTEGSEVKGSDVMVDLLCRGVSAVFGPENSCYVEGTIAESRNMPILSYGCTDERASKLNSFIRTIPSEMYIIKTVLATLKHNDWKKFTIIYSEDYATIMRTLKAEAHSENMTINGEILYKKEQLAFDLQKSKENTRIYVFIGHRHHLPELLTVMAMTGLLPSGRSKKEYLLIYMELEEYNQNDWHRYVWGTTTLQQMSDNKSCLEHDLNVYENVFMVVANRVPQSDDLEEMKQRIIYHNKHEPFCQKRNPYEDKAPHIPYLPSAYLYDSVQLYVQAVVDLYNAPGNNLTVAQLARDGERIKNQLRNKVYRSVLGYNMTMNRNASSEGKYSLYLFSECNNTQDTYGCKRCLRKISDYNSQNGSLDATGKMVAILDEPRCGYDGSKCKDGSTEYQKVIAWVLGAMLLVLSVVSIFLYHTWKYEQEITGLQWHINEQDLMMSNHTTISNSRGSLVSQTSVDLYGQWYQKLAIYKGSYVCLKLLPLNQKRQELTRAIKKEMRNMREIKQDNVCAFIGAFHKKTGPDMVSVTLITEYSTRGSLLDILAMEEIKLDLLFVSSLVHDLLRGMIFLHSHFGPHGNLKSSNCVVSSRWVLQITDYGLNELRSDTLLYLKRDDPVQFSRQMLWKAPEQLRKGLEEPGTKEGDVYTFGIVLHEIIGRQGPYGTYELEIDAPDIVRQVKAGFTVTGSLYRPDLNKITQMPFGDKEFVRKAMQAAWKENPADRPTMAALKVSLKGMHEKSRKGNLMDHLGQLMEQYSKNLEDLVSLRTQRLKEEQRMTKNLLHRMLPPSVASCLVQGITVEPQGFDAVTIYFSDIVGFTALSTMSTPFQVVQFLNDLYTLFDKIIRGYDVYKVETIGDAYMVVSGLPSRNMDRHAGEIASMALELLHGVMNEFQIRHRPNEKLQLRIGLHTGEVIAGVVGITMPRYCLFGDTVNTASRMESNGEPLRIHISKRCKETLDKLGGYEIEERGLVNMKGLGKVLTFWLNGATDKAIQRRECTEEMPQPLLRVNDPEVEVRRRSPRLSSIGGRISSMPRSIEDSGDVNGGVSHFNFEDPRDSPRLDSLQYRFGNLYNHHHHSSTDNTPRGSMLCPPTHEALPERVQQSISLDDLPQSNLRLEVPAVRNLTRAASPSSSEPTLPLENTQRGVNFCPVAHNERQGQGHGEREPMLNGEGEAEGDQEQTLRGDNSPHLSEGGIRHPVTFRSMLNSIFNNFPRSNRPNPQKNYQLSLNGLRKESLA